MKRQERLEVHPVTGPHNSLREWKQAAGFWRTVWHFVLINIARFTPWMGFKNLLYRLLGARVERGVSVGLMAMFDIFFPYLITIGEHSIIGYNTTILCHEFLLDEWRRGPVVIGKRVMIGANCTILPGVVIGDGATVSAHSLVNRDVPAGAVYGGVPARELNKQPGRGSDDLV